MLPIYSFDGDFAWNDTLHLNDWCHCFTGHKHPLTENTKHTGPNGTVAKSSANGLEVLDSHFGTGSKQKQVFKGPMGR